MLKGLSLGKTTALAGQGVFTGTKGLKRLYGLWKKGQTIQEEYKNIVGLCIKKI